jgi:hypothetical protein
MKIYSSIAVIIISSSFAFADGSGDQKRKPAQVGTKVDLWVYDDSVDATAFITSQDFQRQQIGILFNDKNVKKILDEEKAKLLANKKALMVKAYGCGAHASSRNNLCEVAFTVYSVSDTTDQNIFARLFAFVNVTTKTVSSIKFEKEDELETENLLEKKIDPKK